MSARAQAVARAHERWRKKWGPRARPEDRYEKGTAPSQYTEGIAELSAGARADAELHRMVAEELRAAGLPLDPWSS